MAVDGITLGLLTDELASTVTGCRIDKIFQPDKHTVILHLRGYSGIKKLLISILPSDPHINLSENVRDNPQMPPSFCMLLRKYIAGSRIMSVTNPGYERLIEFTLSNTDELHDNRTF
ncbi:MAG: NFACT family protein, partial [Lachnospiraceae bacterium]|nr:NFACT family protein [Lachnospiraceae bacterium]